MERQLEVGQLDIEHNHLAEGDNQAAGEEAADHRAVAVEDNLAVEQYLWEVEAWDYGVCQPFGVEHPVGLVGCRYTRADGPADWGSAFAADAGPAAAAVAVAVAVAVVVAEEKSARRLDWATTGW